MEEKTFNISTEAKQGYIKSLYKSALGREANSTEVNSYNNKDVYDIAHSIIFSEESNKKNNVSGASNENFVKLCYKTILGREADVGGISANLAWLNNRTNKGKYGKSFYQF